MSEMEISSSKIFDNWERSQELHLNLAKVKTKGMLLYLQKKL